jgi:hypothetical protein
MAPALVKPREARYSTVEHMQLSRGSYSESSGALRGLNKRLTYYLASAKLPQALLVFSGLGDPGDGLGAVVRREAYMSSSDELITTTAPPATIDHHATNSKNTATCGRRLSCTRGAIC